MTTVSSRHRMLGDSAIVFLACKVCFEAEARLHLSAAVKRSAKSVSTGGSSGGHTAKKEGGASGGKDEAEPEVKDERTWLQKNWIYLIPAVFMVSCPGIMCCRRNSLQCTGTSSSYSLFQLREGFCLLHEPGSSHCGDG